MKLTIGKRILLGFGIVVALAVALGLYVLFTMAEVREIEGTISDHDLDLLAKLNALNQNQGQLYGLREKALATSLMVKSNPGTGQDPKAVEEEWRKNSASADGQLDALEKATADYEKSGVSERRKAQFGKIRQNTVETRKSWDRLKTAILALFGQMDKGDLAQLVSQLKVVDDLRQELNQKLQNGINLTNEGIQIGKEQAAATYRHAQIATYVGLALVIVLGVLSSLFIQRSITNPLGAFMGFVERVGKGDLTRQAPVSKVGELESLGQSLNQMTAGLKDMARQIVQVTQHLNAASAEIMASTQEQAASTKEQAATVQEITTTMEEVNQSGAQISAKAKQVAAAAEATSVASNSGIQAVQDTTRTMAAIREQVEEVAGNIVALSEKTTAVGEIIATVNDIAERSNLLALNASIEAAAAGDQGSRFSVVANEMKKLADQAKESTVQVRTILGDIQKGINSSVMFTEEAVKRVETGKQQADITEQTIRQMAKTTLESVQAFEQIIGAGNQQQIGFEQVAQGMKDIRQAAEQTATATSQLEKAVANLNALSQELKEAAGRYQI
ncbi:MAG: methyl-accepting chemotaxis protein [Planctomycetes bacterium]|nr:methyl-accepting chemotaxis protein [Planctomycetota bacterium]